MSFMLAEYFVWEGFGGGGGGGGVGFPEALTGGFGRGLLDFGRGVLVGGLVGGFWWG